MKDPRDTQTAELIPAPRKRGRPSTGKALTGAQRQARYRAKMAELSRETVTVTLNSLDCYTLKIILANTQDDSAFEPGSLERLTKTVFDAYWAQYPSERGR